MKGFNAMFRFAYANQNNAAASAMCAEAASSCTSQSSRFNCIALGAIMMASIIILLALASCVTCRNMTSSFPLSLIHI